MAKKNESTLSALTLGVVEIAPHVSTSNKLGISPIERIESVGEECEHHRATATLLARSRDCPECSDSRRSRHSSVREHIQQVRQKPFKRIDLVGKDVIIITNDQLRSWREVDKARTWP
jgi:hypothetical protein